MWTVASYVVGQKLKRRKQFPVVLMLEPLMRCNLACAGCGKIQYPGHILKKELSPEECFKAVDECGAPMVSIPGGEPLMHPQIVEIVEGLLARKKYIYLCTNGLLMKEKLHLFKPSKYFSFVVHMDGLKEHHDFSVCREGTYDKAMEGIKLALERGFRVTTNTTLFEGADPQSVREFFDTMMDVGVEGMMLSPGYTYDKAQNAPVVPPDPEQSPPQVAVQHEPALPRVPDGQARVQVHSVGHADLQHLRLAETVLSPARRLRRYVRRAHERNQVGALRHRERQSEMRKLHGA
jgi:hopanoid biosynthesis associated radical SAM protein HpnH